MPVIDSELAVMVDVPTAMPSARPPAAIVATDVGDELHVALLERFWVLPSLYVPVAVNCWVVPAAMDGLVGLIEIEVSTGAVTVSVADPLIEPEVAVIVVAPRAIAVASPPLTVATEPTDELHVAVAVRFCVEPSL